MIAISGVFAAAWLGYFALLVLLPITYTSVDLATAVTVLAIYVMLAIACTYGLAGIWRVRSAVQPAPAMGMPRPLDQRELCHLVIISLCASCIGLVLLAYVRVVVQGIDYSQGLAVARELWRTEGEERGGISSPLTVPGYGLGFFFFAATFLGHLHWEHLTRSTRRLLIVGTVLLLASHSVLTGGRSILLIQLVSIAGVGALRRAQGKRALPGRATGGGVLYASAGLLGAIGYFLYIFSERATASGIAAETYVQAALAFMAAVPTERFFAITSLPEPLASTVHFVVIAGAYVTHSAGTLASVMEYSTHNGVATFLGVRELSARLAGVSTSEGWVLSGAFLSLPGAFWYDYGLKGVVVAAAATGGALGVVWRVVSRGYGGGISIGFAAAALITALLSPLILAPDSLSFPFMMLGYVGLSCYSYVRFGGRNWWNVGRSGRYRRLAQFPVRAPDLH